MKFKVNTLKSEIYNYLSAKDTIGADVLDDLINTKVAAEEQQNATPLSVNNLKLNRLIRDVNSGWLTADRKIAFIKDLRTAIPGLNLLEAKLFIEALMSNRSSTEYANKIKNNHP